MAYTQTVGSTSQYTQIVGVVQTTQSIHNKVESATSKQEAQTSQYSEANAIMQAASIKDNNHSIKVDSNMKEDLQMLQLAAIIESGHRASANGYTNTVGYTKQVGYTNPVGDGYAPLIGTTSTELETEAALEAGLLQEPAKERTPINQPFTHSPQQPVIQDQPQGKKTLLDRIKANPVVFAVVAAILAFIGYRVYKAKKG